MSDFDTYNWWKERAEDLQARLSAAEKGARENHEAWGEKYRALQARLSAAEEMIRYEQDRALRLLNQLERAEAVVEAARHVERRLGTLELRNAIRHYEEGK